MLKCDTFIKVPWITSPGKYITKIFFNFNQSNLTYQTIV